MTLNITAPFAYYVGDGVLDFDFSKLRNEKRITWANNQEQAKEFQEEIDSTGYKEFHNKYYRILESYPKLRDLITYNFNLFLENTMGGIKAKISTSWITYMTEGEKNLRHRHSNCFYSGVLYFDEDYNEESAKLELENPIPQQMETIIPLYYNQKKKHNQSLSNIQIAPKTGQFLFFPSICCHGTNKHVGDPRKSLAFNFVFDSPVWAFDSTWSPDW
mgnify:CR=1 FL=1|tara:strand:+ start:448 stop:1098 length:651 start_codon:yes stop_codon:yes gene_type:complete